jgi:hypothetical protein
MVAELSLNHPDMGRRGVNRMNIPYPPLHYYQNQGMVPGTGPVECVTTCVVMVMNMLKDRLAHDLDRPAIPDITVRAYAARLDGLGIFGWGCRLPSNFFIPAGRGWMHPIWQAPAALREFAGILKKEYGVAFTFSQPAGSSLEDITQALEAGKYVIVHGLWPNEPLKEQLVRFGGGPHSLVPVLVAAQADQVLCLDPADPDPGTIDPDRPATYPAARLSAMPTAEFLAFWGRKSLLNLYTRPFTMTVLTPDEV